MSLAPEFLNDFQLTPVTLEPTEVEDSGGFRVQSSWGFDSIPTSQKDWLCGNTVQVFEPIARGTARVWEITSAFGVPYDVPRMEIETKVVPAFAGEDLDGAMQEMGYEPGQWNPNGWPMLTFTLTPGAASTSAILEHFRESGMNVEEVLSKL